jgi:uncharacterized membrane protein YfcA
VTVGLLMVAAGIGAGVFGSLLGLGGGILIVPILTLGFGLDLREAVGVSLISVIMTSSAAAGVYLERHVANMRLGMTLELFTALGAMVGGSIAFLLAENVLEGLFAVLLGYVAFTMSRPRTEIGHDTSTLDIDPDDEPGAEPEVSALDRLSGEGYRVRNLGLGIVGAAFAGIVSALLGIGGGIIKVPLMNVGMGVPLRVATATSNMMIGITAAASAIIYASRGGIDAYSAAPTAIGVFLGATAGSRLAHRVDLRILRWLFVAVLLYTAVQMLLRALG